MQRVVLLINRYCAPCYCSTLGLRASIRAVMNGCRAKPFISLATFCVWISSTFELSSMSVELLLAGTSEMLWQSRCFAKVGL
jgi:hypothetical protein